MKVERKKFIGFRAFIVNTIGGGEESYPPPMCNRVKIIIVRLHCTKNYYF
jgi:hypothetical protein